MKPGRLAANPGQKRGLGSRALDLRRGDPRGRRFESGPGYHLFSSLFLGALDGFLLIFLSFTFVLFGYTLIMVNEELN